MVFLFVEHIFLPEVPKEIVIEGEAGTKISKDGNEVFASRRGILHIRHEKSIAPYVKSKLFFSIEPIKVISGSQTLNITTDKPVKIEGGLKAGSSVISRCQVIVSGDIEDGVSIQTCGSIYIKGNITGGNIASEDDIDDYGNVADTRIVTEGKLTIKGTATNSVLTGNEVYVNEIAGGAIIAWKKIEVDTILANDYGYTPSLKVGSSYYKKKIVQENDRFIDFAKENLDRIAAVFGREIVSSVDSTNISRMIILYMKNQRKVGVSGLSDDQRNAVKNLLESVGTIRDSMQDKIKANEQLRSKKSDSVSSSSNIIVKSSVKSNVTIEIDGIKGELTPSDGAVIMEVSEGLIRKQPLQPERKP